MSYLQLMTFWINRIQALQYWWKIGEDLKGDNIEDKPYLVTFHESMLVSLWTFQTTLIYIYIYIYNNSS